MNLGAKYASNEISTTRYAILTFLPVALVRIRASPARLGAAIIPAVARPRLPRTPLNAHPLSRMT